MLGCKYSTYIGTVKILLSIIVIATYLVL